LLEKEEETVQGGALASTATALSERRLVTKRDALLAK